MTALCNYRIFVRYFKADIADESRFIFGRLIGCGCCALIQRHCFHSITPRREDLSIYPQALTLPLFYYSRGRSLVASDGVPLDSSSTTPRNLLLFLKKMPSARSALSSVHNERHKRLIILYNLVRRS